MSSNPDFVGNFICATTTAGLNIDNLSDSTILFSNVKAPTSVSGQTATNVGITILLASSTLSSVCKHADKFTTGVTVSPDTITTYALSTDSIILAGPDSVDAELSFTFSPVHSIPDNGSIKIDLETAWDYTYATCVVIGLSDLSKTSKVTCLINSDLLTISSFKSAAQDVSIEVKVLHLLPPISGASVKFIKNIFTFDEDGHYIDLVINIPTTLSTTDPGAIGKSSNFESWAFPNLPSAGDVDLALSFSLTLDVPANGVIEITAGFSTWSYNAGSIQDKCYSNVNYLSCVFSNEIIIMTIADDLPTSERIQIYLEKALSLPSQAGETSSGFLVTSK